MSKKEKQFLSEFIELYRSFPCLWKIKSKEYSDRYIKSQAYEVMTEKMREFDSEANRESVVKKINTLRTAYRRELKKVMDSERSGVGEEDVYVSHLWYFDSLNFIRDQEVPRKTQTNIEDDNESEEIGAELDEVTGGPEQFSQRDLQSVSPPATPLSSTSRASNSTSRTSTRTTKRQIDKCDEVLHAIGKHFAAPTVIEDKFTLIGKTWAVKLRDLSPNQAIHAEKLINDVFYAGQLENLTASCCLQIPSPQPTHRPQNHTFPQQAQLYQHNIQPYYHQYHQYQGQPYPSSSSVRRFSSQSLSRSQSVQQSQQLSEEADLLGKQPLDSTQKTHQYEQEHHRFLELESFREETNDPQREGNGSSASSFPNYQDI